MVICACIIYLKLALGVRKRFTHNALTPKTYQLRMPVKTSEESEEEENWFI